jgi:hypothetical protein
MSKPLLTEANICYQRLTFANTTLQLLKPCKGRVSKWAAVMTVHKWRRSGDNRCAVCFSLCRLLDAEVRRWREDEAGHRQRQRARVAIRMGGEVLDLEPEQWNAK